MKRVLLFTLVVSCTTAPAFIDLSLWARQNSFEPKVARVGLLPGASAPDMFQELKQALQGLGWTEGENLLLIRSQPLRSRSPREIRKLPLDQDVSRLLDLNVNVLVAGTTFEARAAKDATKTIPIVFWSRDPVGARLVGNLDWPGENITGITAEPESPARHLGLLKKILPELTHVEVFVDSTQGRVPILIERTRRTQAAARSLGLELHFFEVRERRDLDEAFSRMKQEGAKALYVLNQALFGREVKRIAGRAIQNRLALLAPWKRSLEAGALVAYEPDLSHWARRAAEYLDEILRGANPGDLRVDQSTEFRLLINLKTARKLRIQIPDSVLAEASEVIR